MITLGNSARFALGILHLQILGPGALCPGRPGGRRSLSYFAVSAAVTGLRRHGGRRSLSRFAVSAAVASRMGAMSVIILESFGQRLVSMDSYGSMDSPGSRLPVQRSMGLVRSRSDRSTR